MWLVKIFKLFPCFSQSSVGVGFEVDFNTALSPERKAAIGQMLIQYLIDNDWTIPILSLQPQVISVPVLDFGNSTDNGGLLYKLLCSNSFLLLH